MEIKVSADVLNNMRLTLKEQGMDAVRFELTGFGWKGPSFDIVLDEQKDNDIVSEIDGVKFVAEKDFAHLIKSPEIVENDGYFEIKSSGCCG